MYMNKYNHAILPSPAEQDWYYGMKNTIKEAGLDDGKQESMFK